MEFIMSEMQLTSHNLEEVFRELEGRLSKQPVLLIEIKSGTTGKWGMARLWRSWMKTTAEWMAANGATMPLAIKSDGIMYGQRTFDENDAHQLFTNQWLGVDSEGLRLSWSKKGRDGMRAATKGERFSAMLKHEAWAVERGINLFKPRDSEFEELSKQQNQ